MLKKDMLEVGVLYHELDNKSDIKLFFPQRLVIGFSLKDENIFLDVTTGIKFMSLDNSFLLGVPEGVCTTISISEIKKRFKTRDISIAISKLWESIEKGVYFFSIDEEKKLQFCFWDINDYENTTSERLDLIKSKDFNRLTEEMLDGNLSVKNYNSILYGIDQDDEEKESSLPPINEVYEKVNKMVINQERAIKSVLSSIYKNRLLGSELKDNILLCGPTGVGKTEIIRSISKVLDIPVIIEDCTRYTAEGYVGASVDDMLINIYNHSNGDLNKARKSILYLDEIDKKADKENNSSFNKKDVLHSLLKLIEGGVVTINIPTNRGIEKIEFDTSELIVILGGAFSDLYVQTKSVGFDRQNTDTITQDKIDPKVLEKYGIPREFSGRIRIVPLNSLSKDDFLTILMKSEISPIKKYEDAFRNNGVEFNVSKELYSKIVDKAYALGVGARGLKTVVDSIFEDVLYDYFNNLSVIDAIDISEDVIDDKKAYVLRRKEGNGES